MRLPRNLRLTLERNGETRRLVLRKHRQETYLHILMKILAYIYFWQEDLPIEPNFRYKGYKPDLLRLDDPDNPKQIEKEIGLWVECKQVKLQKLDDLARYTHGEIFWFHTRKHLVRMITKSMYKKYRRLSEINIIAIDSSDLDFLIRELSQPTNWKIDDSEQNSSHMSNCNQFQEKVNGPWNINKTISIYTSDRIDPIELSYFRFER